LIVTRQVNIHQAKTGLSKLIQSVIDGEDIVIAKAGKPMVRLVPYQAPRIERKPGVWRGQVEISPDFDTLPPEIAAAFRGETP
jgi:prevent-host-death family protein